MSDLPQFRPYQETAIRQACADLEEVRSTLLVMAVGTGKTPTLAGVAAVQRGRGHRVLVIAHREELLSQAAEKLRVWGSLDVALEMGASTTVGMLSPPDAVVASIQSLHAKRLQRFRPDEFGLIIVDEAHHAVAKTYRQVFDYFPKAKLLGVTATPDRSDGAAMRQVFERVSFEFNLAEAIRAGYLVPIRQCRVEIEGLDFSKVRTTAGDLNEKDLEQIMLAERPLHEVVDCTIRFAEQRPTIVFATSIAHAEKLALVANRYRKGCAEAIHGKMDRESRSGLLARFARGEFQFLVNCLDEKTEILTKRGWTTIDEFREDDITAVFHRDSETVGWQPVSRVIRRERAPGERMVAISNQTLDVRVTEGHSMLVRARGAKGWKRLDAETLPDRVGSYQLPMAGVGLPDQVSVPLGTKPPSELTLDECRFLGLWITDGTIDRTGGCRGVTIGQSGVYVWANEEIQRILTSCGFDWKHHTATAPLTPHLQHIYRIPKGNIGGKLARRGFAHLEAYLDKDFSPLLFGLNVEQTLAFIEGAWLGDGVKFKNRKLRNGVRPGWHICKTNKTMLDRLQILATTRGFATNLSPPKYNGPKSNLLIYTLRIRRRSKVTTNNSSVPTSGGNPARFEEGWRAERVWCVTNEAGTIITRRNGKVMIMGQCSLLTEGVDIPQIACVSMARPTESRALFVQCLGRACRLFPGKSDALILDFVGNAGKHRLVTTTDILGEDFSEDAQRLAQKRIDEGEEVLKALEQAELDVVAEAARQDELRRQQAAEAEQRRLAELAQSAKVKATVKAKLVELDSLSVLGLTELQLKDARRDADPAATEKQVAMLQKAGIDTTGMTTRQASLVIDKLMPRIKAGLSTVKQVQALAKRGLDARDWKMTEATWALDQIRNAGWQVPAHLREWAAAKARGEGDFGEAPAPTPAVVTPRNHP